MMCEGSQKPPSHGRSLSLISSGMGLCDQGLVKDVELAARFLLLAPSFDRIQIDLIAEGNFRRLVHPTKIIVIDKPGQAIAHAVRRTQDMELPFVSFKRAPTGDNLVTNRKWSGWKFDSENGVRVPKHLASFPKSQVVQGLLGCPKR